MSKFSKFAEEKVEILPKKTQEGFQYLTSYEMVIDKGARYGSVNVSKA